MGAKIGSSKKTQNIPLIFTKVKSGNKHFQKAFLEENMGQSFYEEERKEKTVEVKKTDFF